MSSTYINFCSTSWNRNNIYFVVCTVLGVPGIVINARIIYKLLQSSCPIAKPFKYFLLNNVIHYFFLSLVVTVLFQAVPFGDKLSCASQGLSALIPTNYNGHAMLALSAFFFAESITSTDYIAMFRYKALLGYMESRIVYEKSFLYGFGVGYSYSFCTFFTIFFHQAPADQNLMDILKSDNRTYHLASTLSTFRLYPVITILVSCIAVAGCVYSIVINLMITIYVHKNVDKNRITSRLSKRQLLNVMNLVVINTLTPYFTVAIPMSIWFFNFMSSGYTVNIIRDSEVFMLSMTSIIYSWPSISGLAYMYLIKLDEYTTLFLEKLIPRFVHSHVLFYKIMLEHLAIIRNS